MTSLLDSLKIAQFFKSLHTWFTVGKYMCLIVRLNYKWTVVFYDSRFVRFLLRTEETYEAKFPVAHRVHRGTFPFLLTEPSVTIHSSSDGIGRVIALFADRHDCAFSKCLIRPSVHLTASFDCRPDIAFSSGASRLA